ncbi:LysR family transcriptional regulator [Pseudonocardia sulfidoxydans NBRC 16205]|uniref:LysR family transcriptional regulator n=1 Tax=Pseudonocardia sulfidoxydans NBRC 16205 TaxID=1223511 RepID=A0A511DBZ6_9PSEU|nr:LysR family transcriptional regulator [Pseudonocardia sulfidoxydans]GEL21194.1 LysR family transcriptional regulator [Pseudonocardia sulfidoxydans NBRC 16205]
MAVPTVVLDIVALRSLVAVADCGGFHRAAEHLVLSQPAVSQHVRRLQKAVGRPLVERVGRNSRFTPEGEALVGEARRIIAVHDEALRRIGVGDTRESIVLGTTEHAADELLGLVSGAVSEVFPDSAVRFRLDRSDRLNDAIERGTLDLAMYIGDVRGSDSVSAGSLPLTWYAAPGWRRPAPGSPIPLLVIDSPCTIRRRALETLADNALSATVVGEAAYLAGVLNAARAGLGVVLLAGSGSVPEGLERRDDLPPVRPEPLHLRAKPGSDPRLRDAAARALGTILVPA